MVRFRKLDKLSSDHREIIHLVYYHEVDRRSRADYRHPGCDGEDANVLRSQEVR
jgi:hypothetical protein